MSRPSELAGRSGTLTLSLACATLLGSTGIGAEPCIKVDDNSFKCILEMTSVRQFQVDNLAGKLAETVAVATASTG